MTIGIDSRASRAFWASTRTIRISEWCELRLWCEARAPDRAAAVPAGRSVNCIDCGRFDQITDNDFTRSPPRKSMPQGLADLVVAPVAREDFRQVVPDVFRLELGTRVSQWRVLICPIGQSGPDKYQRKRTPATARVQGCGDPYQIHGEAMPPTRTMHLCCWGARPHRTMSRSISVAPARMPSGEILLASCT